MKDLSSTACVNVLVAPGSGVSTWKLLSYVIYHMHLVNRKDFSGLRRIVTVSGSSLMLWALCILPHVPHEGIKKNEATVQLYTNVSYFRHVLDRIRDAATIGSLYGLLFKGGCLNCEDLFGRWREVFYNMLSLAGLLQKSTQQHVKPKDFDMTFAEFYKLTGITYEVVCTHLSTGTAVYMSHESHPHVSVFKAMFASAALDFVVQPVEIDGEYYYDGGLSNNFPLSRGDTFTEVEDPNGTVSKHQVLNPGTLGVAAEMGKPIHEAYEDEQTDGEKPSMLGFIPFGYMSLMRRIISRRSINNATPETLFQHRRVVVLDRPTSRLGIFEEIGQMEDEDYVKQTLIQGFNAVQEELSSSSEEEEFYIPLDEEILEIFDKIASILSGGDNDNGMAGHRSVNTRAATSKQGSNTSNTTNKFHSKPHEATLTL